MSRTAEAGAAASSAPQKGSSTYSLLCVTDHLLRECMALTAVCSSADSSEDLLDHLEDFPLVPDTSLVHAITSVPYENANDSLKDAFLEMTSPVASATPGSQDPRSFAREQQVYLDQRPTPERDGIERCVLPFAW